MAPPRKLLILDIDETLVYTRQYDSLESARRDHEYVISEKSFSCIVRNSLVVTRMRPGLRSFLTWCFANYDVAFWSAGVREYVEKLVHIILGDLGPDYVPVFVWSREHCVDELSTEAPDALGRLQKSTKLFDQICRGKTLGIVKPLWKVWKRKHGPEKKHYGPRETLHIDDHPHCYSRNYGNGIPIAPWRGDPDDDELVAVTNQLHDLLSAEDVRTVEKRWRVRHDA
jgi:TFIIF-interacting CTD phosphatase-like protein